MHEVAEAAPVARVLLVLPAGGLPEVRHGAELHHDGPPVVVAPHQRRRRLASGLLLLELDVDVAHQVVRLVVTYVQVLNLPKLVQLLKDVLIEVLEVLLQRPGVRHGRPRRGDLERGVVVHVGHQQRLADRRLVVDPGAPVAVPRGKAVAGEPGESEHGQEAASAQGQSPVRPYSPIGLYPSDAAASHQLASGARAAGVSVWQRAAPAGADLEEEGAVHSVLLYASIGEVVRHVNRLLTLQRVAHTQCRRHAPVPKMLAKCSAMACAGGWPHSPPAWTTAGPLDVLPRAACICAGRCTGHMP